ncbi:flocculation protein FLO11 [Diachasma alloeum]|uniref:flocculation protein FLO11 n=1 Tax=Diachasma alloeum TaxID=454923 RepID=UPI00073840F8|nr:flocculation protein FLO11 [Diachasma alloeum]
MGLRTLLWLCIAVSLRSADCAKESEDAERARLPELLTELDLASLEASEEDIDALKKVVKRLAPAKNGEYQVFQVFFGNEELLKEWLSGAGLGQPGVDFPMLTTIPATEFSCRGLKGGYYADLETNCQVFHICDNGRKISFLCPNGTIFQQSQLICDWWFKVDCSKSTELYEQSAEQLAQEERKRADLKRVNSEFHRSDNNYQNSNYDGKQNARTNPYGPTKNQLDQRSSDLKSRAFDPSQIYNQNRGSQFSQINDLASNSGFATSQEPTVKNRENTPRTTNYQNIERQQNQLIEERSGKQFYDQRGSNKYSSQVDNYHTTSGARDNPRSAKARPLPRDEEGITNRATPAYTETTTFRTSTPAPIREYQQPAESAAFASSRGNRYNKPYNSNQYNSYYNPATNAPPSRRPTQSPITPKPRQETPQSILKPKGKIADYPYPTFAPIYRPRTTTYDSTTPTTTPPYTNTYYNRDRTTNWETTTNLYTTGQDYRTTTETVYPDDITGTYQGARVTSTDYTATTPNPPTTYTNSETYDNSVDTRDYPRTTYKTRASPSNQRYSTGSSSSGTAITKSAINDVTVDQNSLSTRTQDDKLARTKTPWKGVPRTSQNYRQNGVSPSTEKSRTAQLSQQSQTSKTPPPYDTSITYQNGKVMSTLGPYVPFTKNYAYTTTSTTTTQRPPVYTATVPTYSSPSSQYRSSGKAGRIQYPTSVNRVRGSSTYLPDANSTVKRPSDSKSLIEHEHAFNMLESLRGLEGTMPTIIGNTSRSGLTIPHSSSPATLHSLALYFATASDEFGGSDKHEDDSSERLQTPPKLNETSNVDLPTSILTEHTINSYAELFNLNNALETSPNSTESEQQSGEIDSSDDLDLQQSEGPVTSSKKSNSTKLRELAQVFTHALSAYLQDPATFKKILAEIRPTEPPAVDSDESFSTTTYIPATSEEYPSVTKEKDEVLDFSEDVTAPRRPILQTTTEIPTTTDDAAFGYYTTSVTSESQYSSTPPPDSQDYLNPTNDFASAVNHAFDSANGIQGFSGPSGPTSNDALNDYENYFPDSNRVGDIQRNSTYEPYGKYVKPVNSVPIGDNYVSSSTPATYEQTLPPENPGDGNVITSNRNYQSSGENFDEQTESPEVTTTVEPFRIRYYDTTTIRSEDSNEESLVTANSIYSSYNNYNRLNSAPNDVGRPNAESSQVASDKDDSLNNHWTSSPTVTQLWESTVFVDPKRINQGLTSEGVSQTSSVESFGNDPSATTHSSVPEASELLVTDASGGVTPRNGNRGSSPSTTWQWSNTDNDAPTAFSLLPTVYSTEHTATPAPIYTTRSSITTTITSSVISTSSLPQPVFPAKTRLKNNIGNATENEIVRAKQMFGGLNDTSSDVLMRVMKTADQNATVRQLVLLLISHCTGPLNKTREEEKEQLLNALLSMPVDQFTSEESRGLVDDLTRLNIPDDLEARSTTAIVTSTEPIVTTFKSKKSRRIKSNVDEASLGSRGSGGESEGGEETSASDGRALELLRSLYTVAAKWG